MMQGCCRYSPDSILRLNNPTYLIMKKKHPCSRITNCFLLNIVLFIASIFPYTGVAQKFTLNLFHSNKYAHSLCYYSADNVYSENLSNKIALKKVSDTNSTITLSPESPGFMQLNSEDILVLPAENTTVYWNDNTWSLEVLDTISTNYSLEKIKKGMQQIIGQYHTGAGFADFKRIFELIKFYADSTIQALKNAHEAKLQPLVKAAIQDYVMMRLAHFAVLPVLFKNDYEPELLRNLIKANIKISSPALWMQTQSGHIFLRTYYAKLLLPAAGYSYKIALKNNFLSYSPIKKYVSAFYFEECIAKGNSKRKEDLLNDFNAFKAMFSFQRFEKEELGNIERRINKMKMDIAALFAGMELEQMDGKRLTTEGKNKLINSGNIMIDLWASWCRPCREKMEERKTASIKINGEVFNTVYLSIDEKRNLWTNVKYPFFTTSNCFRIVNGPNEFTRFFQIESIPRYILIKNGKLVSDKYNAIIN